MMDQIDLNIGNPLLSPDQHETVIYMDSHHFIEDESNIFRKNETLLIDSDVKDSIISSDLINSKTLIINNDTGGILSVKSSDDMKNIVVDDLSENNNRTIEGEEEMEVNGQVVELADGTTAFIENFSKTGKNEVFTPMRLYNGSVIYVVSDNAIPNDSDSLTGEDKPEEVSAPEVKQEKSRGFQCSYKDCNKSYTSFHHLKVHLRVHTGDRPFRCSVEGCNKAFSTGFGLKTHFRTHNGERPYMCNYENCEKGFKTSGDLQKHIRTHTGERPFLCPIPNCGRSFTTCNICKVHVRTHTGERPYKCNYPNCNKTFASVTNQRNHMRIHSGEKPYVCSVEKCGRRFTEYSSLYKHNMVHRQQPHLCLICGKTYRQASGLVMHTKSAHGDQEAFLAVDADDKNSMDKISAADEQTAILFVDNIKLEDGVLEDSLFTEFREATPLNV